MSENLQAGHIPLRVQKALHYKTEGVTYGDYGNGRRFLETVSPEAVSMNKPFKPFTMDEMNLLVDNNLYFVQKYVPVTGVPGLLRVSYTHSVPIFPDVQSYSPWETKKLSNSNYSKYPYELSFCFNETNKQTPMYKIYYPDAVSGIFDSIVTDWDVIGNQYDATHQLFLQGQIDADGVEVFLPSDPSKLAALQVTVVPPIFNYPTTYNGFFDK